MVFWVRNVVAGILFAFAGFAMATTVIAEYDDAGTTLSEHASLTLKKQKSASGSDPAEPVPLAVWLMGFSLVAVAGVARLRSKK